MLTATIAIQVLPKMEGDNYLHVIESVINHIEISGVDYYVGPLETTMSGDFDRLMEIVKQCQLICIEKGAKSVSSYINIVTPADACCDIKGNKFERTIPRHV
jgi:uncharacterized protein YqgV (UPF0045/DUF77 family)